MLKNQTPVTEWLLLNFWKLLEESKSLLSEVKEQLNVLSKDGSVGDLAMPEDTLETDTSVYGGLLDKAWSKINKLTDNEKESK